VYHLSTILFSIETTDLNIKSHDNLQVVKTGSQAIELSSDGVTIEKLQLDIINMKIQLEEQLKECMLETKESIQLIQQDNSQLKTCNDNLLSQLSITQQQLLDVQNINEQLQKQLSYTQQQLEHIRSMVAYSSRLQVIACDEVMLGEEIGRGAWATVMQ